MRWLQRLIRRGRMEKQLDEELLFHLDQYAADLMERGVTPTEARRQARLMVGGLEQIKEDCRDARGTRWLEDFWQDLRCALRTLSQNRGFATLAVLTLALGIGTSTAIFSAVNPILFRPLSYQNASRILAIWDSGQDGKRNFGNFAAFRGIQERSRTLETIGVARSWQPTLTGVGEAERLEGQYISADYLRVLGVQPFIGRGFTADDDRLNGPRVAIVSHSLWRRRFGSDPAMVGRQILLDDTDYTVIGVMPDGFRNMQAQEAEVWRPLQYDPAIPPDSRELGHHLRTLALLRPGVSGVQASAELEGILHALSPMYSKGLLPEHFEVLPLQDDLTSAVKGSFVAVLGAVLLLLVIACMNVTNLMLARASQRTGEFAMRVALGAGRTRLMRQLLTESLLVAAVGGTLGIGVALASTRMLSVISPPGLPRGDAVQLDITALAFAIGVSVISGLVCGLIPSLQAWRGNLLSPMHQTSRRTTGSHQFARRVVVVAEVSLAVLLLVGSGLLLHSLQRLFAIDTGFETSRLLTMQIQLSRKRFGPPEVASQFFIQASEAVRSIPGVQGAAFTSQLPLSGDVDEYGVRVEPGPDGRSPGGHASYRYAVTPGYLETLGIPLRRGRLLDARDTIGAPTAALVSDSLMRSAFGGQDPIGQRIRVGPVSMTVVGVVGDVKQTSLAASQTEAVYVAPEQWMNFADHTMSLVVRTSGDALALADAVKQAVWSVDRNQPIMRVATMESLVAVSAGERRFAAILFEAFALAALVLATIGIYGVLVGSVAERTREIGLRTALGATRADVVGLVVRQGMTLTGVGMALGICAAAFASSVLDKMLFGISSLDPVTYGTVIALLLGASAMACWLPAWRAAHVDPAITLRAE